MHFKRPLKPVRHSEAIRRAERNAPKTTEDDTAKDGALRKGPQRGKVEQGPKQVLIWSMVRPKRAGRFGKTNQARQGHDNGTL
jgi:hypothetical protein